MLVPRLRTVLPFGDPQPCRQPVEVETLWHTRGPLTVTGTAVEWTAARDGGEPGEVRVEWTWRREDGGDGRLRSDWFDKRQVKLIGMGAHT